MSPWLLAFGAVMQIEVIFLIFVGVILGLILGAIPGLTAVLGIVLLLPITYGMEPVVGLSLLMGIYIGGISGGLVSATLLGMPGTPSSIATTFDAFPLAKKGYPGKALGLGITASFVGSMVSWVILILLSPQLARFALSFGPFEYTMLILFGLTVIIGLSGENMVKGIFMAACGLLLATIGTDPIGGFARFTGGISPLRGGISFVPALIGLFVIGQVFLEIEKINERFIFSVKKMDRILPELSDILPSWFNFLRSSVIGTLLGILPGIGGSVANFVCYDQAKKASKTPENFGQGDKDGIIASETGNNATVGGALIPMLTLGIPGDTVTAVLLGGLMLHGLRPGPFLMRDNPELVYGIFLAMLIATIIMYLVQMTFFVRVFTVALRLPKYILLPVVMVMAVAGTYNIQYRVFDIWITLMFGFLGYLFTKLKYPLTPMVISLILGPIFERNLRMSLMTSGGSMLPFVTRPISLVLLAITLISVVISVNMYRNSLKKVAMNGS